jgi:HEAT repeats
MPPLRESLAVFRRPRVAQDELPAALLDAIDLNEGFRDLLDERTGLDATRRAVLEQLLERRRAVAGELLFEDSRLLMSDLGGDGALYALPTTLGSVGLYLWGTDPDRYGSTVLASLGREVVVSISGAAGKDEAPLLTLFGLAHDDVTAVDVVVAGERHRARVEENGVFYEGAHPIDAYEGLVIAWRGGTETFSSARLPQQTKATLLEWLRHDVVETRLAAVGLLAEHAVDPEVERALFSALRDEDPYVRKLATATLISANPDRDSQPILDALRARPAHELSAAEIVDLRLEGLRSIDPIPRLLDALDDSALRARATRALGRVRDERALPALVALTHDEDADLREDAVLSLGRYGEAAIEPLLEASHDSDASVRDAAAALLGQRHRLAPGLDRVRRRLEELAAGDAAAEVQATAVAELRLAAALAPPRDQRPGDERGGSARHPR